jgi:hypothetical protein
MTFLYTDSFSKFLVPSLDAFVIRWSHSVLTPKFTLNLNNGLKFCILQYGLCIFLSGGHCTDHVEQLIKAAVR